MPETDVTKLTYKDVEDLEIVPSKGFVDLTDAILLIQNDTTRRATISTLLDRLKETVTVINGKSAYEIAVTYGFDGTEKEWLNSLNGSDDLKAILGDYAIVDAAWSGNSLVPVDSSESIPDNAYIIYKVMQRDYTYKYYTINAQGTGYDDWSGIMPLFDVMSQVVRTYTPETIYASNGAFPDSDYVKITYVESSGASITSAFTIPTTGDFGNIYNVKDYTNSEDTGTWYFNTYGTLHEYLGVAQYIQTLLSETLPSAKKATTADKLTTGREITLKNSEDEVIGKTTFDGSEDVVINFTPGMINAALLAQENGLIPINISGTATKLATARSISLTGIVSGSASFDGSEDVTIETNINADKIVAGSAKKLTNSIPLKVTGGGSNDGISKAVGDAIVYFSNIGTQEDGSFIPSSTQVYTWYPSYGTLVNKYDGSTPVDLVLTRVNASVLYGDTPAAIDITGSAASAGSFKVEQRSASTDVVLVGAANTTDMTSGKSVLYDQNVYVSNTDTNGNKLSTGKPTIISPQFKGTLIGAATSATKATEATLLSTNTKSITSTYVAFEICEKTYTQTISDVSSYDFTVPMHWAANVFIDSGDSAITCANYILSVNAGLEFSFDGTTYKVTMGSNSASSSSDWSSAITNFYTKYNSTYLETEKFICANKLSGQSYAFGLLVELSGPDTDNAITITTRVVADCTWASSFDSRKTSFTLSSFGALPMPSVITPVGYDTHFSNTGIIRFYESEPFAPLMRAKPDTDYGEYRFRNIAFGTATNPTSASGYNSIWGGNGSIYFKY